MWCKWAKVCICVFVVIQTVVSGFSADIQFNTCLPGNDLVTYFGLSLDGCIKECIKRTVCQSVNYYRHFQQCDLKKENSFTVTTSTCLKCVLVDVRHNNVPLLHASSPCANDVCSSVEACNLPAALSCIVMECSGDVLPPSNGIIYGNKNNVGDQRLLECNDGYDVVGPAQIHCQASGYWTTTGICEKICGTPPVVDHGIAVYAELRYYNSTLKTDLQALIYASFVNLEYSYVEYRCQSDYSISGFNVSQCINGNWSLAPTCVQASIGSPCASNAECTVPASECRGGQCRCETTRSYDYGSKMCVNDCVTFADTFQMEIGKKLNFLDDESHYQYNFTACKARCLEVTGFVCQSFDLSSSLCLISANNANDGLFRDATDYTYYQRDCLTS